MARGDAVQTRPTLEQEMSKFKGFSVTNGEISDGAPTDEEKARLAANRDGNAHLATSDVADATANANAQAAENLRQQNITTGEGEVEDEENDTPQEVAPENETEAEKATRLAAAAESKAAKSKVQERINKATAKQRTAERELAREREERARERGSFEARLAALEKGGLTPAKDATTKDPNAPKATDYEFGELDAAYVRDVAKYEVRKELAEENARRQADSQTAAQRQAAQEFQTKLTAFEKAGVKKFGASFMDEVVETARAGEWPLPATVGQLIFNSPVGPDVAHYLASNADEAQRIAQLSPVAQAAAFGRLEAKFSSATPDATGKTGVKVSKAPPVPASRARGAGQATQVAPETSDFKAFEAMAMRRN